MLPLRLAWVTQPTGGMPGDRTGTVASDGSGRALREHRARRAETDIPLDVAAFCIAAHAHRPASTSTTGRCRMGAESDTLLEATFDGLRAQLFDHDGFHGDLDNYADPEDSFLDSRVIERLPRHPDHG